MSERVADLARRVGQDPYFLAFALAVYARSERLDEQGLAVTLGCAVESLVPLRLCRHPSSEPSAFRDDVTRIATHVGVDPAALAQVIRRADALEALRQGMGNTGLLLAARDRCDQGFPDDENGNQP